MGKIKDPDPLAMDGLEPDAIRAAVDQRHVTWSKVVDTASHVFL